MPPVPSPMRVSTAGPVSVVVEQPVPAGSFPPLYSFPPLSERAAANDAKRSRLDAQLQATYGADELLGEVVGAALSRSTHVKLRDARRFYLSFCLTTGLTALPATVQTVAKFTIFRVLEQGLSAEGVLTTVGYLRRALSSQDGPAAWAVDPTDGWPRLRMVARGLQKIRPKQNLRGKKQPIQLHHLRTMREVWLRAAPATEDEQHWVQMLVAHQGMLRTNEHVGGALRLSDVAFITADSGAAVGAVVGAVLTLRMTKTGTGQRQHQQVVLPRRNDELDVVGPLMRLVAGRTDPEAALFQEADGRATSRALFIQRVQTWLLRAGISGSYSGHSFRAGGATDAFDSGVPFDVIVRQGRWTSDAWKEYRHSTLFMAQALAGMNVQPRLKAVAAVEAVSGGAGRRGAGAAGSVAGWPRSLPAAAGEEEEEEEEEAPRGALPPGGAGEQLEAERGEAEQEAEVEPYQLGRAVVISATNAAGIIREVSEEGEREGPRYSVEVCGEWYRQVPHEDLTPVDASGRGRRVRRPVVRLNT
jgi:hypothetical protein